MAKKTNPPESFEGNIEDLYEDGQLQPSSAQGDPGTSQGTMTPTSDSPTESAAEDGSNQTAAAAPANSSTSPKDNPVMAEHDDQGAPSGVAGSDGLRAEGANTGAESNPADNEAPQGSGADVDVDVDGPDAAAAEGPPKPPEVTPAVAEDAQHMSVANDHSASESQPAGPDANSVGSAASGVVPAGCAGRGQSHLTYDLPVSDRTSEFVDLMKDSHRVFRAEPGGTAPGKRILLLVGTPPHVRLRMAAPAELRHDLANYIDVYSERLKGYISLPMEETLSVLHSVHLSRLPAITRVANGVAYNGDYIQLSAGYDPATRTYVTHRVQADAQAVGAFRQLCRGFKFKDEASFVNLLGFLLIAMLGPLIVRAPGLMIMGDLLVGTTAGKTTLALMLKVIIDAFCAPRIYTFPHDEKEYVKLLGGILSEPNERVVVFDNVKPKNGNSYLENQTFEQQIGARVLNVRVLGTSHQIARINDLLFVCTANGPSMAIDFANRFIHSHLEVPDGGVRPEPMIDKVKEAEEQRERVLAELAYMVQVWKEKGAPLSTKCKHRDQAMASLIGGIMEANGYDAFLANHSSALAGATGPLVETYYTLASLNMAKKGGTFTALEWVNHVRDNKALKQHFPATVSLHSQRARANTFLQHVAQNPVVLDGIRYTLTVIKNKRNNNYFVTEEALPGHEAE
ncbi:MAG: hypothetical protein HS108_08045 [Planctomycetes bacterium]|nr:hypothetical protein [Planctomycetota bacterium]